MEMIRLEKINKAFDGKQVLNDWSASFPKGKLTCIMAASGKGKTTLLRILMGFGKIDSGTISGLEGMKQSAVFQEERLCEHLTPVSNIRLVAPKAKKEDIIEAMRKIGLTDCSEQPVCELSGGMRRRVSLLRALFTEYDILLLDEPFKGLDEETKEIVMRQTLKMCNGRTVLLITHDPYEAEAMSAAKIILL